MLSKIENDDLSFLRRINIFIKFGLFFLHRFYSWVIPKKRSKTAPFAAILAYHKVHPNVEDEGTLTVSPKNFKKQLSLVKRHYDVISLSYFVKNFKELAKTGKKFVVITFDDGYKNNYDFAIPLLEKYNLIATFFCTAGYINTEKTFFWDAGQSESIQLMTWENVRDIIARKFEIGSHTVNHVNLGEVNYKTAEKELFESKKILEQQLSDKIELFAYPFGGRNHLNPEYVKLIKDAGYICNCSCHGGLVTPVTDIFLLPRVPVNGEFLSAYELLYEIEGIRLPKFLRKFRQTAY